MNKKEKLKIFEKHLKMMKTKSIRMFTEYAISKLPDYFWTLLASTTRKHHGASETLIDHVQGCLFIAEKVIQQFEGHWTDRQGDQLMSALILHDGWRCGEPGKERRFTQEDINEKGYPQELLGELRTSRDHPEVGYQQLLSISVDFNLKAQEEKTERISAKNLQAILKGVRYHYGPWCRTKLRKPFSLSWPFDSVVMQVHNIDHMQMINAQIWTREKE